MLCSRQRGADRARAAARPDGPGAGGADDDNRRRAGREARVRRSRSCSRTDMPQCSATPWNAESLSSARRSRRRASSRPGLARTRPSTTEPRYFLKAADLLTGPRRDEVNAATMLGQSKTCYQAEIDAACELADFWRFNVHFANGKSSPSSRSRLAGRLEPLRPPTTRGIRPRDHTVQLHGDRRQPSDRAGADGCVRGLEAVPHAGVLGPDC